jgi:non-heme chloroperoxidase
MKPELFLIHGMWGRSEVWSCYKQYFEGKGYSCSTPTLRFHDVNPLSDPDPRLGRVSVSDYVEDLSRELGKMPAKPIIIGHSMGGLLAQMLAERQLASAIVLLSPAPAKGTMFINRSVLRCFKNIITKWGFWRKPALLSFADAQYALFGKIDAGNQKRLYSECVHESGRAIGEIGFAFLDGQNAAHVNAEVITCPVLILVGKEDRITPVSVVRKAAGRYGSNVTFRELDNHAHWLLEEPGWEEVVSLVDDWIEKTAR